VGAAWEELRLKPVKEADMSEPLVLEVFSDFV